MRPSIGWVCPWCSLPTDREWQSRSSAVKPCGHWEAVWDHPNTPSKGCSTRMSCSCSSCTSWCNVNAHQQATGCTRIASTRQHSGKHFVWTRRSGSWVALWNSAASSTCWAISSLSRDSWSTRALNDAKWEYSWPLGSRGSCSSTLQTLVDRCGPTWALLTVFWPRLNSFLSRLHWSSRSNRL